MEVFLQMKTLQTQWLMVMDGFGQLVVSDKYRLQIGLLEDAGEDKFKHDWISRYLNADVVVFKIFVLKSSIKFTKLILLFLIMEALNSLILKILKADCILKRKNSLSIIQRCYEIHYLKLANMFAIWKNGSTASSYRIFRWMEI